MEAFFFILGMAGGIFLTILAFTVGIVRERDE